jgi:hypothetical protein
VKRAPVASRSLASVGYDRATNVLEIEYRSGDVYRYFAVPASTFAAMLAADSIGAFVNQRIKPRHRCLEVYQE